MEILFIIAAIFVISYLSSTRVERKKKHFQNILDKAHIKAEEERTLLIRLRQKSNIKKLSMLTKNELKKYQMELPPRIYIEVDSTIDSYIKAQEFDKLFSLHNLLITSDNKTILKNLKDFNK